MMNANASAEERWITPPATPIHHLCVRDDVIDSYRLGRDQTAASDDKLLPETSERLEDTAKSLGLLFNCLDGSLNFMYYYCNTLMFL